MPTTHQDASMRSLHHMRSQAAQVQSLTTELAAAKAAAAAAEQKSTTLETALQQSSSLAIGMTTQVAQAMADANAQVRCTHGDGCWWLCMLQLSDRQAKTPNTVWHAPLQALCLVPAT
jgi:type II secretory pathway component PulM